MNGILRISDGEFRKISDLVYQRAGINLHDGKKQLVQARLGKIIRREGFAGFREYFREIDTDTTGRRLVQLLDTLTTNHTYFYRESDHLKWLSETIIPDTIELNKKETSKEIRIWSAGCSTGEEPYTIAIHLMESGVLPEAFQLKILATDLSTQVVQRGREGIYKAEKLQKIPSYISKRYFRGIRSESGKVFQIAGPIRRLVTFRKLNLLEPFPFRKQFDVVFCRNVMIYFDKQIQQRVVNKLYEVVKSGGYFVVGHSESLSGVSHQFEYVAPTIYKKTS